MPKVNSARLIEMVAVKTTVYMPIVEAIANSIDAIEERKIKNGEIRVELTRNPQLIKSDDENIAPVSSITITDNGIGFDDENTESFDKLFSEKKIKSGGKGFGRFTYLKYFTTTKVDSNYKEGNEWKRRTFVFVEGDDIVSNPQVETSKDTEFKTKVELSGIRPQHQGKLNKRLDTIARRLFEILLPYFVTDGYKPPKIIIIDPSEKEEVILNGYLKDHDKIQLIYNETAEVEGIEPRTFQVKIFKIYHSNNRNSVALTAHHRQVTHTPMHKYDPEFIEGFSDTKGDDNETSGNYIIKAYVIGDYLDENVSLERGAFNFPDDAETAMYPVSKQNIEKSVTKLAASKFNNQLQPLKNKKIERVKTYIDDNAPWNKSLLKDLDYDSLPFNASEKDIDTAVHRVAFDKEQEVRTNVQKLLRIDKATDIDKEVEAIAQAVTDLGKSELAHYVSLRRAILNVFEKSLKLKDNNRHELENIVHKLIFPQRKDTDTLGYENHNLWLLDERLSFSEYVASDKPLNKGDERPDLLSFDRPIAVRAGDELSNPITIFELKRPGRTDYSDSDNPLTQVTGYVQKIRSGQYKNPQGRQVHADENTPAYCFVVCDLTPRIIEFCNLFGLTQSPDKASFYGFHPNYHIYYEVLSFDKVLKDATQRNKVFFRKLGVE
jgi:hypothetical protein